MDKNKKSLSFISNKLTLIVFSAAIFCLVLFVILSFVFLSPVDSSNDSSVEFKVESGWGKNTIAEKLEDAGLIKNALFFKFYIKLNSNKELYAGTYNLSKSMSVDEIIKMLNSSKSLENESVSITFIEGKRITDYAKKISEVFDYSTDEVLETINNKEFVKKMINNYSFITDKVLDEKIYYPLEGYLFPDTYIFKKTATIEEIIDRMINTMGQKIKIYEDEIKLSSYNMHELLTLASIVELEGVNSASSDNEKCNGNVRACVAGVFYNRLKDNWSLGSDVTTYYGVKKDFSKDLTRSNLSDCNGYNTRAESSCPITGLPVGPIASPSLASITAVIEPAETDAYYFVADKNKKTYFSKTYNEHTATVANLKNSGLWYEY